MSFGDAPNYSTPRTLALAGMSILVSLAQFALGALEYGRVGRYPGLAEMLLAGLLLVYGILTLIRYAEAQDALHDPVPRAPMYDTPHEWLTYRAGVGLNGTAALVSLAWMIRGELRVWHALAALLALYTLWLAWRSRPGRVDG